MYDNCSGDQPRKGGGGTKVQTPPFFLLACLSERLVMYEDTPKLCMENWCNFFWVRKKSGIHVCPCRQQLLWWQMLMGGGGGFTGFKRPPFAPFFFGGGGLLTCLSQRSGEVGNVWGYPKPVCGKLTQLFWVRIKMLHTCMPLLNHAYIEPLPKLPHVLIYFLWYKLCNNY